VKIITHILIQKINIYFFLTIKAYINMLLFSTKDPTFQHLIFFLISSMKDKQKHKHSTIFLSFLAELSQQPNKKIKLKPWLLL